MLVFGRRGTPDASLAFASVDMVNKGVATSNTGEAQGAKERGETVLALGPNACKDLGVPYAAGKVVKTGNVVAVVGKNGADTMRLLGDYLN